MVDTGAYAVIRHPMYAAALPMFLCMPPALGSYWGVLVFVVIMPALIWRLLDEERFLKVATCSATPTIAARALPVDPATSGKRG